ncbi:MAG TPA: hypothetical protein VFS02_23940 [Telluria sp.]|nr:hypothetical protein [Telluria sp.]
MTHMARVALPTAALAALLAACGGGGGGDAGSGAASPPPVVAPAPVETGVNVAGAWKDYVTAPHTWTMPGKGSDARAFELSVVMKPGAVAAFPLSGASGQTSDQSLRFAIDGANTVSTDGTLYFTAADMLGVASNDGACAGARAPMTALPTSTPVGSSGAMFVLDGYAGCKTTGQRLGATTFSWSVEKDGELVMFCITSKQEDSSGVVKTTEVDCMETSINGSLGGRAKFTITKPDGNSISGRNF